MEEKESLSKLKLKQTERTFPTTKPSDKIVPVSCPSCSTSPAIEDVNIHDKIAKCGSCGTVFSFAQEVNHLAQSNNNQAEEEVIVRPVGIEKSYFHDELELTMQQPTGGFWILMIFFMAFFAGLFYLVHLKKGIPIYWPLGFGSMALLFYYKYLNKNNDKIYTTVDEKYLSIQYRPKYFSKDKLIPAQEIEQLYVKTLASNYYSLYAIQNTPEGQKHVLLIQYLDSRNKARYMEREIEEYLGIEDKRLPEESTPVAGIHLG
ncbi:MAG: hypothetical protein AAF573_01020 [Bacteroidota bacterium]